MIKITDKIWIGGSDDGFLQEGTVGYEDVDALLNVARDLRGEVGHPDIEYIQVGLLDGPGNEIKDYCAAVLALASLEKRHEKVLVYDHSGNRALIVTMLYTTLKIGHVRERTSNFWSRWMTWDECLTEVSKLSSAASLLKLDSAHRTAYEKFPFGIVEVLL